MSNSFRVCSYCVMDTTDPNIEFDKNGRCNHCRRHDSLFSQKVIAVGSRESELDKVVSSIKASGRNKDYDCILGLSGGVDSSYVAYLAHSLGLRPLAVHLDNGWNSEIAVKNIHNIVKKLNFDLHTHVIDWEEFRDLQKSFFKASVVDIEMLSDHAITAIIYGLAKKHGIKYVLSGCNWATESIMPISWAHRKSDLRNIRDIHKKFGSIELRTFPQMSTIQIAVSSLLGTVRQVNLLNFYEYDKTSAMKILQEKLEWRYYGGKHYESTFTKFYQAFILPQKFGIDKRKAHFSSLICSGQITRDDALEELSKGLYSEVDALQDGEFVRKKLGFSEAEFESYLNSCPISHYQYKSDEKIYEWLICIRGIIQRMTRSSR